MHGKKGLSPIIASVLLISISLVLAILIFFWARDFIGDSVMKNQRDVSLECNDVRFDAEAFWNSGQGRYTLRAVNNGNVPIYGFEIKERSFLGDVSNIETLGQEGSITVGETSPDIVLDSAIVGGDEIIVVPVLLGETETNRKPFVCDENVGLTLTVSSA